MKITRSLLLSTGTIVLLCVALLIISRLSEFGVGYGQMPERGQAQTAQALTPYDTSQQRPLTLMALMTSTSNSRYALQTATAVSFTLTQSALTQEAVRA